MTLNIKKAGAYSAAAGVFVKKAGVYSSVQAMFVKVAGAYQNVLSVLYSAIALEGDNYLYKAAALTGVSNAQTGSVSFWFTPNSSSDGVYHNVFVGTQGTFYIDFSNTGKLRVVLFDGSKYFVFSTTSTLVRDVESHYAISWNTGFGSGLKQAQLYRNGVPDLTLMQDTDIVFTPVLNGIPSIGATNSGASPIKGLLREMMYWPGVQIDWAANISKVYSASGPVDVGATGSLVTGTAPKVYLSLKGSALPATILTNYGTGGDFILASGKPAIRADTALIGYGDSLVFGTGSTIFPTDTYFFKVCRGLNTPRRNMNYGVGGTSATQIAGIMASGGFSVPAASVPVSFTKDRIWVLDAGYNDVAGVVSNGLAIAYTPFVSAMISTLNSVDPGAKWVFLGVPTGNIAGNSDYSSAGNGRYTAIQAMNSWLAANLGSNFLDINAWILSNWTTLNYTSVGGPATITPTGTDILDVAAGVIPSQLRSPDNSVHWNNLGQYAVSVAVLQKLTALGYN